MAEATTHSNELWRYARALTLATLTIEARAHSAAALQSHDFKAALNIRDREYGHGEGHGAFDDSITRTMELIMSRTPALLADCPPDLLEPLRVAAAMMELWGVNTIRQFVTIEGELHWEYRFEPEAIAHMLHSHACFLRSLEGFRRSGITTVKLVGSGNLDDCEACRAADGGIFTIDIVPELPLVTCRCETGYGCRMIVTAQSV